MCFSAVKKRKFNFNLSFQQGYGVYKLSHATASHSSLPLGNPAYHDLLTCDFSNSRLDALQSGGMVTNLGPDFGFSTTCPVDSSSHAELLLEAVAREGEAMVDRAPPPCESGEGGSGGVNGEFCRASPPSPYQDHNLTDTSSVFEGSERRLSHVECRTIELTDWEWCRSKSERTPRQVSETFTLLVFPQLVRQLLNLHEVNAEWTDALGRLALREISDDKTDAFLISLSVCAFYLERGNYLVLRRLCTWMHTHTHEMKLLLNQTREIFAYACVFPCCLDVCLTFCCQAPAARLSFPPHL